MTAHLRAAALLALCSSRSAAAFPLFGDLFSLSSSDEPEEDAADVKSPCPDHRPLPPIDPVEGLSWLDHVQTLPMPCFEKLNLGWEDIEDSDAPRIVRLVHGGVKVLTLYQNHLGDDGAVQIASALKDSKVVELDLGHNQVGDEGAIALANALSDASALRTLRLNGNRPLRDAGVQAFSSALHKKGVSLEELWLSAELIGKEAIADLSAAWAASGRSEDMLHM